jgi:hypothetical protein
LTLPEGRVYLQAAAGNNNRGYRQTCDADTGSKLNADSDLGGEEPEKAIKELPRDKEVVQPYKKLAGAEPLPARRNEEKWKDGLSALISYKC